MGPVAIPRYMETRGLHEEDVTVESTGLHIYDKIAYLGASPDGTVRVPSGTGLLVVKYSLFL